MNYESHRLNTFSNWPSSAPVDPIRIAKAGFFYTGQGVEVQCFCCGGKVSEWNYGDQVMARHRRLDANCPFVVNPQSSGNVALLLGLDSQGNTANGPDPMDVVHDYGVTEDDEMYKSDALRLLSFVNWDDSSVSRESLVSAGFYHAGEGRLRCAWCGGELASMRRLGSLGDPLDVHLRYFPGCTHARAAAARAAALASAAITTEQRSLTPPPYTRGPSPPVSPDACDNSPAVMTEGAQHNARVLSGSGTWRSLGVVGGAGGARHPQYSSLAARLASFTSWPADRAQTPHALADAGFYYAGADDQVRCFSCDGGLGKWEAGDAPWREHARWFPHCGYLLLVKGRDFVAASRDAPVTRTFSADTGLSSRRLNSESRINFPITESQVSEQMESPMALAALGAGLDAARVRRAITRRLRATGLPFGSSEALIDAVLDAQLNEEAWSVSPQSQRLARDILNETLREFAPQQLIPSSNWDDRSESRLSQSESPRSLSPFPTQPSRSAEPAPTIPEVEKRREDKGSERESGTARSPTPEKKPVSLEEENRQLKEARLCKVCMDGEVSVVFLPCGHLVSCASCGAGLGACPLCRARVQALVRAYLA